MTQQGAPPGAHRQGRRLAARIACLGAIATIGVSFAGRADAPGEVTQVETIALEVPVEGPPDAAAFDDAIDPTRDDAGEPQVETAVNGLRGRLVQGGWVMVALLGCSLLVVAVSIERAAATRRALVWPAALRALVGRADGIDRDALRVQVKEPASVGERLVRAGLRAEENGIADVTGVVAEIGAREVARLRRGLPLLANLANIATMLGLFGTVLGMIDAFELIAAEGTGDPRIVADGIFKALVTTAAGLAIGIAALAIHAGLSGRVDARIRELEDGLGAIFDPAATSRPAPARPATRSAREASADTPHRDRAAAEAQPS